MAVKLTCSRVELADLLDLSVQRVGTLTKTGILPKAPGGKGYEVRNAIRAYLAFLRSKSGSLTNERSRLTKAQADLMELKVKTRSGELLEKRIWDHTAWQMYRATRDAFLNIGSRIGGLVAAEQDAAACSRIVDREITTALWDLSAETERASGKEEDAAKVLS